MATPTPGGFNPRERKKLQLSQKIRAVRNQSQNRRRDAGATKTEVKSTIGLRRYSGGGAGAELTRSIFARADYGFGKTLHLLQLGAELEQQQIRAGAFEFTDTVGDLLRSADEAGAQATV